MQQRLSMTNRMQTGSSSSVLQPDRVHWQYAAVLSVCAAYLWTEPWHLHMVVCQLERQVAGCEAEAARRWDGGAHSSSESSDEDLPLTRRAFRGL